MPKQGMAEADPSIFPALSVVPERIVRDEAELDALLKSAREPFLVRGLVASWPLVKAGLKSNSAARTYLVDRARPVQFAISLGPPEHNGRMFYDEEMAMNFRMGKGKLSEIFAGFEKHEAQPGAPTAYLGSIDIRQHFDGVAEENPPPLGDRQPRESIWIGTATRIAAHNDFPDNLACCAAGKRRFTLFPPDQFKNLYLGPLDNTPAGRPISMVDFDAPDYERFPRFADALEHAQVAVLEPGDAVFIPSMWWHHVEGLAEFNILVNYWWRDVPSFAGDPQTALNHAILALRDLPDKDKAIWRDLFDHYVFENGPDSIDHIPAGSRGILEPLDSASASRLRAFLLRMLNS